MTLIKSISGIRGTIGGSPSENLTPLDAVKFSAAYGTWLKKYRASEDLKVVIGRDARLSGPMIQQLVSATLTGLGIDVVDLGLSTTPTVELAVPMEKADGGIILTACHNPKQWNALKLPLVVSGSTAQNRADSRQSQVAEDNYLLLLQIHSE